MNMGAVRLGLAAVWLAVGVGLLLRERLGVELGGDPRNLDLGAWLAFALAAWNVTRWYLGRRRPPARQPLRPRRDGGEYNPELDFDKGERGASAP